MVAHPALCLPVRSLCTTTARAAPTLVEPRALNGVHLRLNFGPNWARCQGRAWHPAQVPVISLDSERILDHSCEIRDCHSVESVRAALQIKLIRYEGRVTASRSVAMGIVVGNRYINDGQTNFSASASALEPTASALLHHV